MVFVANFLENTTVEENRPTLVKVMNKCIVAQFFLTRCVFYTTMVFMMILPRCKFTALKHVCK